MLSLDTVQNDALTEIFNISLGRAAAALGKLVKAEIIMRVPSFQFLSLTAAAEQLNGLGQQHICGVSQRFEGLFAADVILMFPEERSLEIVHMMLDNDLYGLSELSELEQEAMSEIGNIIINACIATIANISGTHFSSTLPIFRRGSSLEILKSSNNTSNTSNTRDEGVLFVYIDFNITQRQITGYLAFMMSIQSAQGLVQTINRFLRPINMQHH